MDRFKFKLQKVLDYREGIEEVKKEEFAEAQRSLLEHQKKLERFENTKKNEIERCTDLKTSYDYQCYIKYIEYLNDKIENQKQNVYIAEECLSKKTEELIGSMMDRKVIEKLKDKAKQEFEDDINLKEQKQNDDFALYAHARFEGR